MKRNFKHCLDMLLEHEGGFVDHPKDPGGMTNLGVTRATYEKFLGRPVSEDEMRWLKPEDVYPVYKQKYWDKVKGDDLPTGVDWSVFDWAVNSGPARAIKALQHLVGAKSDGVIGPKTLAQIEKANAEVIVQAMHDVRQRFYEGLSTYDTFGKGWTRRNAATLEQAMEMIESGGYNS